MDIEINPHEIVLEYLRRIQGQNLSIAHVQEIEAMLSNADGEIKPKTTASRIIIFLESTKFKYHEGYVFRRFDEAQNFLYQEMNEGFFQSAKVGVFVDDTEYTPPYVSIMNIDTVKKKEFKKAAQLKLFKP
ncbi:hypothetical protein [Runella slithyformis]|uniref:Uncharacterized protein n=1 Tax=Runella slithyformis (strain ATCC 29530 / DSM 19594 / LMG 11500 / NCIMB 11436 / LSU 4) TaxID=761193 RepID=A0A7U4E7D1_RUNSL|nr:hypothetical protein [Runella slithyformis]AEI50259.1 hypothetical protein Runsl_3903 [Runella slithyformis DSM 19594]